jgi:alginate O-acetyltransferase complex protein AlgI
LLAYYLSPGSWRNPVLLLASLLFYAFGEWRFLPWMVASIAVNYLFAVAIERFRGQPAARWILGAGICSDLLLLLYFKYAAFLVGNVNYLASTLLHADPWPLPRILLPLGISFFTFHKISYKIDVYRGDADAKRNPFDLALYILLFPQLIAGPIIRYHEISEQFGRRPISRPWFAYGVQRFVLGLGKKMLVANTVALCADQVFALPPQELSVAVSWLGVVCYTLQIYFDFSGYSDMALGLGHLFGFHFPENFDHPYVATSITEFWRRWHISLSRWFRDYLYIPLGGNRCGNARTYFNLLLVFFLCGLWHGASWTFVLWGLFHGIFLVIERLGLKTRIDQAHRWCRHTYTLAAVLIGWVFFRADSPAHAAAIIRAMVGLAPLNGLRYPVEGYLDHALILGLVLGVIGAIPTRELVAKYTQELLGRLSGLSAGAVAAAREGLRCVVLAVVMWVSLLLIAAGTYNPFIYFRF